MTETVKPEKTQELKRDYALDVLRAIAAIYIIGFWHHLSYIDLDVLKTPLTTSFAVIALGMFFTVSAYLLTQQQRENINREMTLSECKQEVKTYYSKRVFRIYPLYFIAVLLFYALEIGRWSLPHLLTSVTLTAALIDKSPLTLWFINVIFLYYLAMPLIWFIARSNARIIALGAIAIISLYLLHRYTPLIDERIYIYLPSMIFGILLGKNENLRKVLTQKSYLSASVVLTILSLVLIYTELLSLDSVIALVPVLAFPALIVISEFIGSFKKIQKLWIVIGYSSFAAYLFHRVLFELFYDRGFGRTSDLSVVSFGVIVVVPLVFVLSYFVQQLYDRQIRSFFVKRS